MDEIKKKIAENADMVSACIQLILIIIVISIKVRNDLKPGKKKKRRRK